MDGAVSPGAPGAATDDVVIDRVERLRLDGRHVQHWAALQPGIRFVDVPGGFVACRSALGATVVLGDPVCAPADLDAVVDAVVTTLPGALFFQVGDAVAKRLQERHRLYATPLGVERTVDVATFSLRGRHKQALRSARNHATRTGVTIVEVDAAAVDDAPARRWHLTRRRRRLSFVVPPPRLPAQIEQLPGSGRRAFVARRDGEDLGFVVFDPLHEDGVVVGWTPSVSCGSLRFRPGLWYVLVTTAIERFAAESTSSPQTSTVVNLGLAPLARATPPSSSSSPLLVLGFKVLARLGLLYNFRGIEHAKSRFGGTATTAWLVHRHALPMHGLLALWWLVGAPRPQR